MPEKKGQKLDPYHTEQAQRDQQHHHGRDAGTRAAHGTGKAVQDAEQEVERAEPPHGQLAVGDHGLVGGEQVQNGVLSGQARRAGAKGVDDPDSKGDPDRALYPVQTPRAVVLPTKVVAAMLMLLTGRMLKPSIFMRLQSPPWRRRRSCSRWPAPARWKRR